MTARATFRQADLTRAMRAARAAGYEEAKVEIDPATGKIVVYTKSPAANDDGRSDWDGI